MQSYSRNVQKGLEHIQETYGFLFERGYDFSSAKDVPTGWQVVLRKRDLYLGIQQMRGEEELYIRTGSQPPDVFTDIGSVIYAASGDNIPHAESSDVKILERYLDRIEAYFEGEYLRNPDSLPAAQQAYYAASPQVEVVAPPQPKVIPVLHYPLMGVIILLLLGALTTLYTVLLTGLFSVSSLDRGSGGMVIAVSALVLAIGTLLLFRGFRKKG